MRTPWIAASIALVSAAVIACHEPVSDGDSVSHLSVAPASLTLTADDSAPLFATAMTAAGSTVVAPRIAWSSSDSTIAQVNASGEVHGLRLGVATITAFAGGRNASALVRSAYPPLTGVREYAHRGFGTLFPENTLVAADSALARGADGIEADVQLSRDGYPVIIHDPTVDRTTDGTGSVGSMTRAELRALDACSKRGSSWAPCPIPLAEEMIQKVRGRGLLILDLKGPWPDAQLQALLGMVRDNGMIPSTMITSFNLDDLKRTRRSDPRVTLGWLQGVPTDPTPGLSLGKIAVLPEESAIKANASAMLGYDSVLTANGSVLGAWTIYGQTTVPILRQLGVRWFVADIPLDKGSLTAP